MKQAKFVSSWQCSNYWLDRLETSRCLPFSNFVQESLRLTAPACSRARLSARRLHALARLPPLIGEPHLAGLQFFLCRFEVPVTVGVEGLDEACRQEPVLASVDVD
jgi:hypothetical protein